jgi:hypothetical protein
MSINVNVGNNIPAEVIEVGQEISVNQLAAITSATSPSASNPFSTAGHTHVAANITDLSGLLDAKANLSHTHAIANVTGLQLSLDGKALSGHIHNILDVTGLQIALDGKSATTHLHTGIYAPVTHTHAIADVTGLQTALDGKTDGTGYALLTGATFSGEIATPQIGNLLNTDLIIDAYNDTGAGTHYYHKFAPNGGLVLAPNGGYLQVGPAGSVYQLSSDGFSTSWLDFDIGRTFNISKNGLVWDNNITFNYILGNGFAFNDKVTLAAPTAQKASLNLGVGTAPTSAVAGDIWLGANINFKATDGVSKIVANTNTINTFTKEQTVNVTATAPALRITQMGTGDALRVEDSTSPDTTSFIVSNSGKVGIGLNFGANITSDLEIVKSSGATQALNITGTSGLAVLITGSGSFTPALQVNFGYIQSEGGFKINTTGGVLSRLLAPVTGTGTYDKEIEVTINGTDYRIPCRLG